MKERLDAERRPARILLVDDNRHGLLARRMVLEEQGHAVTSAPNAEEALELFAPGRFDLVITDYKMPRMNGVDLIAALRRLEGNLVIILISGFVEPLGLNEATTGADLVLAKNAAEISRLVRAVPRLLANRIPKKPPTPVRASKKTRAKTV